MKRILMTVVLVGTMAGMPRGLNAATPEPTPAAKAKPGQLTVEQLGTMLENLGYNTKPLSDSNGKLCGYVVSFSGDGWTFAFDVTLSPSQVYVWFDAAVVKLDEAPVTSPAALLGALAQNRAIWPTYLYYQKEYQMLRAAVPVTNKDVTPAKLRQEVNDFTQILKKVITDYQKANSPMPAPPTPKLAP